MEVKTVVIIHGVTNGEQAKGDFRVLQRFTSLSGVVLYVRRIT